jgi:hypothetical protein
MPLLSFNLLLLYVMEGSDDSTIVIGPFEYDASVQGMSVMSSGSPSHR